LTSRPETTRSPSWPGSDKCGCPLRSTRRSTCGGCGSTEAACFIPLKDASAGHTSYGAGRYALDTAKSADLGGDHESFVLDLNFLYHPVVRYNPAWVCPLAPPGNTISLAVTAGERL